MRTECRILLFFLLLIAVCVFLSGCNSGCPGALSGSGSGTGSGGSSSTTGSSTCGTSGGGGGGGGGGGPTTAALLYYLSSSSIQGASLNSAGVFANLSPFTAPTLPTSSINSMVIVNQRFLYVPAGGFSEVLAFSINQNTGALATISGSPYVAQVSDDTVTSDPAGRFLFVGGRLSSSISVYQINASTGGLTLVAGSPFQSFNVVFADSLTVDSTGQFLYVGQTFSSNPVAVFSINQSTGALTEIGGSPFPLGVAVLQADPSGPYLLGVADATGASGDQSVHVFSIDAKTGAPTEVAGSPFPTVSTPFALAINPSGNFVYPSVADSNDVITSLEGYQLNASSGALTPLSGSPFTTLPVVAYCQFEQTGLAAFCLNASGFSVLGVSTSTGGLTHTVTDLAGPTNVPFAVTD